MLLHSTPQSPPTSKYIKVDSHANTKEIITASGAGVTGRPQASAAGHACWLLAISNKLNSAGNRVSCCRAPCELSS